MRKKTYIAIMDFLRGVIKGTDYEGHVFAVGGCERDKRLGNLIKDIDLVVDIPNGGIRFAQFLHEHGLTTWEPVVYEHFGTAMFCLKEFPDVELEAVQTRKECYRDIESRNPDTAYGTLQDDCTRRDFTVNAFYYNISEDKELDLNGHSTEDLENKIIRTCGNPEIIFNEDPLRVLRLVRFASRLSFTIDNETFECAKKYVDRLTIISKERIHDEFMKMCGVSNFDQFSEAMFLLWDLGAFKYIIPYFDKFSHGDVYYFIRRMADFWWNAHETPSIETVFAAMLIHDEDAEKELRSLKCSNDFINEVMFLINTNNEFDDAMFDEGDYWEDEMCNFRRFMHKCGSEKRMKNMLRINSMTADEFFEWDYDFWEKGCQFNDYSAQNEKFYTYTLPVDGNDVMEVLGIEPSERVRNVLNKLWKFVWVNPDKTDKESIMNYLKYIKDNGEY